MTSWKVVTVTPAGRRRYLEILVPYLLANREQIAEHHFWLNTRDQKDIEYIYRLTEQYPDFFKVKSREVFDRKLPGHCIWQYWQDCVDEDTIYIRLDDDICFVGKDSIPKLIAFRLNNPDPFFIYGNVVNNALCSHVHQLMGIIPKSWGTVQFKCMDEVGWFKSRFPARVHKLFIADLRNGMTDRWKFPPITLSDYRRFSINVVCWFGKDLREIEEITVQDLRTLRLRHPETGEDLSHEEAFTSQYVPAKFGRPCVIYGEALFSHFAFYPQRPYLEKYTALLDWYAALAAVHLDPSTALRLRLKGASKILNLVGSSWFWVSLGRKIRQRLPGAGCKTCILM
jgi:hypothetical protein